MQTWLFDGRLDLESGVVAREGQTAQRLSGVALACVRYLASAAGRPISREELLTEVWGYHRGVRSRAVDTTVKVIRKLIEPDPAAPVHLRTERGVGYLWEAAPPPPEPPTHLIGRETIVAKLREDPRPLIVLSGPPGVGKTAIGAVLGRPRIDLQGCGSPESALLRIGAALFPGESVSTLSALSARLHLTGSHAIWIDHPEGASPALAEAISVLIKDTALRVLVTTRDSRGWQGSVIRLSPLCPPHARDLLLQTWGGADNAVADALLPWLDGLPLAIVLAGTALRQLPPAVLVSAGPLWSSVAAGDGALDVTLQTALFQLPDALLDALSTLSMLENHLTLSQATALLEAPAGPILAELLTRSLIEVDDRGRYRLLMPVRDHLRAQLIPSRKADSQAAIVRWLVAQCAQAGLRAHLLLVERLTDLENALQWAGADEVGPIAHGLASFYYYRGDSGALLRLAARAGSLTTPRWRARLELWRLLDLCGRGHAALALPELSDLPLDPDDFPLRWFAAAVTIRARLLTADPEGALRTAHDLLKVGRSNGDIELMGRAWTDIAMCARRCGRRELTRQACARALALLHAAQAPHHAARTRCILGRLLLQ
ncbi:MAG: tetratricopeptide (TPR) repeat protein, partial [Myxococcota bacterium]